MHNVWKLIKKSHFTTLRAKRALFICRILVPKINIKTETFFRAKVQVRQFWGFSNTVLWLKEESASLGSTLEDGGGWLVLLAASPPPPPSPWTISGPSLSHMRSWRLFAPLMLAMTEPQQQQQPKAGFLTCFWALDFLMFWAKTEHSIFKKIGLGMFENAAMGLEFCYWQIHYCLMDTKQRKNNLV